MAKTFSQFREELSESKIGGGKEILPTNFLKPSNPKNPWQKTKQYVRGSLRSKQPETSQKISKPTSPSKSKTSFIQKVDKAGLKSSNIAKDALQKTGEKAKSIGTIASKIIKPIAGAAKYTAGHSVHGISSLNQSIKRQALAAAARQSNVPLEKS